MQGTQRSIPDQGTRSHIVAAKTRCSQINKKFLKRKENHPQANIIRVTAIEWMAGEISGQKFEQKQDIHT